MTDPHDLRDIALQCVSLAASSTNIREVPAEIIIPETKSSNSDYVTWVDREIESKMAEFLKESREQDGILAEEGSLNIGSSGVRWIIDPIDGTTNFVYGIPFFGISLAAEQNGDIVAGVVADLGHNEVFDAVKSHGARCNGVAIQANTNDSLNNAIVGTGFSYLSKRREVQSKLLQHILPRVGDIRRFGSAAIDLCWLALGRLDAFYEEGLNYWDYAAGALIASEAGAIVRVEMLEDEIDLLIASNPHIANGLCELVSDALETLNQDS
mgnify:CR=1 FL=1